MAEDYEEAARLRDQIARLKESSLPAEEVEE
ncbi:MAG: UvrB/UvrC motif-containing protein [Clostridia bacterium]|nr:UvrB/UvrC motif-containing protein [Clostridia bacterium]